MPRPPTASERAKAARMLGVSTDTPIEDARKAWQRLVRDLHPDRPGGDAGRMAEVNAAWDIFCQPAAPEAPRPRGGQATTPHRRRASLYRIHDPAFTAVALSGVPLAVSKSVARAQRKAIAAHRLAWHLGLPIPISGRVAVHLYDHASFDAATRILTLHYATRLVPGRNAFPTPTFTGVRLRATGAIFQVRPEPFVAFVELTEDSLHPGTTLSYLMGGMQVVVAAGTEPPVTFDLASPLALSALDGATRAKARRMAKGKGPRWLRPAQRVLHTVLSWSFQALAPLCIAAARAVHARIRAWARRLQA